MINSIEGVNVMKVRNNMYIIRESNGDTTLISYTTPVAGVTADGQFKKLWSGYSATTMSHTNDFRFMYGFGKLSKNEWIKL